MEIKVVLSLVAILSAAAVALFCDFLRTRNLQLREAMVEMKVRREEQERKGRRMLPASGINRTAQPATTPPGLRESEAAHSAALPDPRNKVSSSERSLTPAPQPAELQSGEAPLRDNGVDVLTRRGRWKVPTLPVVPDAEAKEEEVTSKQALSDWLLKRAKARATERTAAEAGSESVVTSTPAPMVHEAETPRIEEAVKLVEVEPAVVMPSELEVASSEVAPIEVVSSEVTLVEVAPVEVAPSDVTTDITAKVIEEEPIPAVAPPASEIPEAAVPSVMLLAEPEPQRIKPMETRPMFDPPRMQEFGPAFEPVVVDQFLWQSLFGKQETVFAPPGEPEPQAEAEEELAPAPAAAPPGAEPVVDLPDMKAPGVTELPVEQEPRDESVFEIIHGNQSDLDIPGGFHGTAKLKELSVSQRPFTGLVVSIGVSHVNPSAPRNPEAAQSIAEFLSGLMRTSDFACDLDGQEFVLICPGETGMEAQRYLSFLSERLWDFQLRCLNTSSILFTLGGVDVQSEMLADALASANERMNHTMRSRRSIVIPAPTRRAV